MSDPYLSDAERTALVALLTETRDARLATVEPLTDAQWRFRPAPGRWTIAENLEHLGLVEDALFGQVTRALGAPPHPEWATATAGKETLIARMLGDRTAGREAPRPMVPTGSLGRAETVARYRERRDRTIAFAAAAVAPLKAHTTDHRRPAVGTLSAYQWLLFAAHHDRRHGEQIAEVVAADGFPA